MTFLGAAASLTADGNNLYITNSMDLVIQSLRLISNPLSSNYGPKIWSFLSHDCEGYIKKFN